MPIRYFLAMCLATLLLAVLFLISIPSEVAIFSTAGEESQEVPAPAVKALPVASPSVESPRPEPVNVVPAAPAEASTATVVFQMDRGGAEIARVVAPESLPLPGLEGLFDSRVDAMSSRELPAQIRSPDPRRQLLEYRPPLLRPSPAVKPKALAERIPPELSRWAAGGALRPVLAAGPPVSQKARDPGDLPRLPVLARPPLAKPSAEDPLAEVGNDAIVNRPSVVVLVTATFVKLGLPDPFAYAEQVRVKLDPASEPAASPVPVNPRRPK